MLWVEEWERKVGTTADGGCIRGRLREWQVWEEMGAEDSGV